MSERPTFFYKPTPEGNKSLETQFNAVNPTIPEIRPSTQKPIENIKKQ